MPDAIRLMVQAHVRVPPLLFLVDHWLHERGAVSWHDAAGLCAAGSGDWPPASSASTALGAVGTPAELDIGQGFLGITSNLPDLGCAVARREKVPGALIV